MKKVVRAEEITGPGWPIDVDLVSVLCPSCKKRTDVQISVMREEGDSGRVADCDNEDCMEDFIMELTDSGILVSKTRLVLRV